MREQLVALCDSAHQSGQGIFLKDDVAVVLMLLLVYLRQRQTSMLRMHAVATCMEALVRIKHALVAET